MERMGLEEAKAIVKDPGSFSRIEVFKARVACEENKQWEGMRKLEDFLFRTNRGTIYGFMRSRFPESVGRDDFVADMEMQLWWSIRKFDPYRGREFSTYVYTAYFHVKYRYLKGTKKRFVFSDEAFIHQVPVRESPLTSDQTEFLLAHLQDAIVSNAAGLSDVERKIITTRFLSNNAEDDKQTLVKVGEKLGISKERVRQIQNVAVKKLREYIMKNSSIAELAGVA